MNRLVLNEASYFGAGSRSMIVAEVARRGFKKAFMVVDKSMIKFGIANETEKVLSEGGILYEVFSDFASNPIIADVQSGIAAFKASGADFIIALGGGACIDTAKAIEMIAQHLKMAVNNGKNMAAYEAVAQAQYIAGMGFLNVGRGLVHSMAYPLESSCGVSHGVANAILLPVMEYNAVFSAASKYIHIARAMGVNVAVMSQKDRIEYAIGAVKILSMSVRFSQKLREIGVKKTDIYLLARSAFNNICTAANPRPVSLADIELL